VTEVTEKVEELALQRRVEGADLLREGVVALEVVVVVVALVLGQHRVPLGGAGWRRPCRFMASKSVV
jgi:hypothetical protein